MHYLYSEKKRGGLSGLHNEIRSAQLRAWLLAAVVPAVLSVTGKNGWLTVLLMAFACGVLCFCVLSYAKIEFPKWLCFLEIVWLTVFLGGVEKLSGSCWGNESAIPIILLILATLASANGAFQSARIGSTLLWLVIPSLGLVFLAGITDVNVHWISTKLELPDGVMLACLLYPCTAIFLPRQRKTSRWMGVVLGSIAVAGTVLICGTLGVDLAKTEQNGFYEFSKGVTLFGVAERFEALVACGLTGGYFALLTLVLSTIYHLGEKIFGTVRKWLIWACSVASIGLMYILPINDYWLAIGGVIFWGFVPVATQGLGGEKNIEKK